MAFSSSSSSSSSSPWCWSSTSPNSGPCIVQQEEFKVFHTIDRNLFARMVFDLKRDPAESTQIMALWLWLEENRENSNLVHKILSYPDVIVDALSNEAVMALTCIESDRFPYDPEAAISAIPLIQRLSKSGVSLLFFHENRFGILRSLAKICNDICLRAFIDIIQQFQAIKGSSSGGVGERILSAISPPRVTVGNSESNLSPRLCYRPEMNPYVSVLYPNYQGAEGHVRVMGVSTQTLQGDYQVSDYESMKYFDTYDDAAQRQALTNEISEVLGHLRLNTTEEKETEIPADERTIFLTFSKGYPIFEDEIRDFFGRRFGDIIEAIHMQEVTQEEQPLYARLVVKLATSMDTVLERRGKAKFSINGKHVWARKYVRKNPTSSGPSSPVSQG